MSDSTDAELARLLDAYGAALHDAGQTDDSGAPFGVERRVLKERAARWRELLLAHIARAYVRRDQLTPDEWDNLDATAPEMERHG